MAYLLKWNERVGKKIAPAGSRKRFTRAEIVEALGEDYTVVPGCRYPGHRLLVSVAGGPVNKLAAPWAPQAVHGHCLIVAKTEIPEKK